MTICPECGNPLDEAIELGDGLVECSQCGELIVTDDESEGPEEQALDLGHRAPSETPLPGHGDRTGALGSAICWSVAVVGGLCGYGGMLAIHGWTTYLVYEYWGGIPALIAFVSPPFSELFVLVACFWWGPWFYFLGLIAVLLGYACLGCLEEPFKPVTSAVLGLLCVTLAGSFTYFTYSFYTTPRPLSEHTEKALQDDACAIVSVIRASASPDPLRSVRLGEAKAMLRDRIGGYSDRARERLRSLVNQALELELCLENDCVAYMARVRDYPKAEFRVSPETKERLDGLPSSMRVLAGMARVGDEKELGETLGQIVGPAAGDLPPNWRELVEHALRMKWHVASEVYRDLLQQPMPANLRDAYANGQST